MPLQVGVVGAGIAGLSAARALSLQGHVVTIFEQSNFANEVGAAIHVAPNATRALSRWGCDLNTLNPVVCKGINIFGPDGTHLGQPVNAAREHARLAVNDLWLLTHRVDLHQALLHLVTLPAPGKVQIQLASRVVSTDAKQAAVTLADGTTRSFDLLVGADGVHSRTVAAIAGTASPKIKTGQRCYRFMVPVKKLLAEPAGLSIRDKYCRDYCSSINGDVKMVIYPCRSGSVMNCVLMFHSPSENDAADADDDDDNGSTKWHGRATVDQIVAGAGSLEPDLQTICRLAEDPTAWDLTTREPPATFIDTRLALIGDAAHPTLPHQGQGAAQAIEDAEALASLMTPETGMVHVSSRLEAYNRIRYKHSVTVMFFSRVAHTEMHTQLEPLKKYVPDAQLPGSMIEYCWPSHPRRLAQDELAASKS